MPRTFIAIAAALGFIGVALGAFGAHGLRAYFQQHPALEPTFETATRYQMIHALALLAVAWAYSQWPDPLLAWAGWLFVAGIILFCGSLYLLVVSATGLFGAIAPLGGLALLGGWALLGIGVWRAAG